MENLITAPCNTPKVSVYMVQGRGRRRVRAARSPIGRSPISGCGPGSGMAFKKVGLRAQPDFLLGLGLSPMLARFLRILKIEFWWTYFPFL